MINAENLNPNRSGFQYKNVTGTLTTEFYGKVNTKLVRAGNLLRGTLAIRKADLIQKKKERELQSRNRFEDRLESKPNVEKRKDLKNSIPRPGSGVGILGWFKNFIGSVALGFFATKLIGSLPLLTNVLKGVMGVVDFVASTGMFLVNAATTFINLGYNAYDSTRGFLRQIGGDNVTQIFDTFLNRVSSLIDVLIIASILRGSSDGGFGPGGFGFARRRLSRTGGIPGARALKDFLDAAKKTKPRVTAAFRGAPGAGFGPDRGRKIRNKQRREARKARIEQLVEKRLSAKRIRERRRQAAEAGRRRRAASPGGVSLERRRIIAKRSKDIRLKSLLQSEAGQRAFEIDQFLSGGGFTNIPQQKLFSQIGLLDREIEKNQALGKTSALKRNLAKRNSLVKKLTKLQEVAPTRDLKKRPTKLRPRRGITGFDLMAQVAAKPQDVKFLAGLEDDPNLTAKAFADAEKDLRADRKRGIRGGRIGRLSEQGLARLDKAVRKTPSGGIGARGLSKIPDRLMLKLFGRRIGRMAGRIPIIGGLIDFGLSLLEGDPIPKAATRATFAGIGGAIGAFIGSLTGPLAPIAVPVAAFLVGSGADALGSFLYDTILSGLFPPKKSSTENKFSSFLENAAQKTGGFLLGIWNFLTGGKEEVRSVGGFKPIGGFVEERLEREKSNQPQVAPRPGSKGIPLPPREPAIPPRKPPMGGKTNFSSLFDLITSGEGGLDSVNYGTTGSASTGKKELGKSLTEMTIDEVHAQQYPNGIGLGAVGKYQIIPKTMKGFIRYLRAQGIDTSKRKFDASIQNMFGPYSITKKRAKVGRFLSGDNSVSLDTAQLELAAEYASIGVPYDMKKGSYNGKYPLRDIKKGESLYSGTGSNYAPAAHTDNIRSMLQKLREKASYEDQSSSNIIINSNQIASNNQPQVNTDSPNINISVASGGGDPFDGLYVM